MTRFATEKDLFFLGRYSLFLRVGRGRNAPSFLSRPPFSFAFPDLVNLSKSEARNQSEGGREKGGLPLTKHKQVSFCACLALGVSLLIGNRRFGRSVVFVLDKALSRNIRKRGGILSPRVALASSDVHYVFVALWLKKPKRMQSADLRSLRASPR